jgi:GAF domain-containing protein
MMDYYTSLISRIHSASALSVENIPYLAPINKNLIGQQLLSQLTNYLGDLRAKVYGVLIKKGASQEELESIENDTRLVTSFLGELTAKSDSGVTQQILAVGKTPEGVYFSKTLGQILQQKQVDPSIDAELWWAHSARLVDELKSIQKRMLTQIGDDIQQIHAEQTRRQIITFALIAIVTLLVIYIIVYTIKEISNSLAFIRDAAENISTGATGVELKVYTKDAIGSLARSINRIDANNQVLSTAADEIGKGNFNVSVQPRSDRDVLGTAVVRMKNNLQKFSAENEERAWLQSGITTVNNSLLGEKSLTELSNQSLAAVVQYLGVELGLLYVSRNDEVLDYTGGYAIYGEDEIIKTIRFGQTLIGQAAISKEIIYIDDIPADYPKVGSASGRSKPAYIIIVPLIHDGSVEGVIELASFNPISQPAQGLLKQVAGNIATAIQAAKSKTRLQELLEETQSQSEELQAQHTEMENLNTELEAQAQKLQASEEELKVQQEELLQSNKELEQRARLLEDKNQVILERNLDIQKKAEELALSTKYKSEFLANMSHELRTPLNSILLLSRLMSENEALEPEQVEYANVIQSSGKGLLSLIDEILDLSKIESGKMDLEYAHVKMNDIVSEVRALF